MSIQPPIRLASEDVIVSAPFSYSGSLARISRLRRRARSERERTLLTAAVVVLVVIAWSLITLWYLIWGVLLVPYRLLRRGARRRRLEALRHRELLGTIQGSAAASAAAIVTAQSASLAPAEAPQLELRVGTAEREQAASALSGHFVAGRLDEDELHERLARAYAARTRAELEAVLGDLPA